MAASSIRRFTTSASRRPSSTIAVASARAEAEPLLVLAQPGLGRVAVPLGAGERVVDEALAALQGLEERPPGELAEDDQDEDEDHHRPDDVAEVAREEVGRSFRWPSAASAAIAGTAAAIRARANNALWAICL